GRLRFDLLIGRRLPHQPGHLPHGVEHLPDDLLLTGDRRRQVGPAPFSFRFGLFRRLILNRKLFRLLILRRHRVGGHTSGQGQPNQPLNPPFHGISSFSIIFIVGSFHSTLSVFFLKDQSSRRRSVLARFFQRDVQ